MTDRELSTALLDTNILYPARMRDILLQLFAQQAFTLKWSRHIRRELIDSIRRDKPDIADKFESHTIVQMDSLLRDSQIRGYEHRIDVLELPDPNDRHVLAAAIQGECELIVTANLRDFPYHSLQPFGIDTLTPDEFLLLLLEESQDSFLEAVRIVMARLRLPPVTLDEYLTNLAELNLTDTVKALRQRAHLLQ